MERVIETGSTVFTAWFSEWNVNTYIRREPFLEQPCLGNTGSTAGAPVVVGKGFLAGLLRTCDAVFSWDGSRLTINAPESALFISTAADESQRWADYHQALGIRFRKAPFGLMPEYCTWVEQIWHFENKNLLNERVALTETMICEYLKTIRRMGWKSGRFTIDEGWCMRDGEGGFGDWIPRADLDMPALAKQIRMNGHVPGIWMSPVLIDSQSRAARENPGLVGSPVEMRGECDWLKYYYVNPSDASQELIDSLFQKAFDWGYRKFKLDVFYGPKPVMYELARQCRQAADRLPEPIELEGHIPDPFCAQYMDVVRINDLMISEQYPGWRSVFDGHLTVCRNSLPGMILNLDHIGGNCTNMGEAEYIEHLNLLKENSDIGYPTLGLLPQHVSPFAVKSVTATFAEPLLRFC